MYSLDGRNSVTIETALELAYKHYDEKTFNHAMRVAAYVANNHAILGSYKNDCIALAIMHDLIEDTSYDAEGLKYDSSNFYKALQLLTKKDDVSYIPQDIEETLVIYTPAIPGDMGELVYVKERGYKLVKRSRALGEIAAMQCCLAVAGTHGKTTTSTMLAHIYTHSGLGCNAFLGGIPKNYHTNLLLSKNPVIVAEADEFDRSFLQLKPSIAVITSMDADHNTCSQCDSQ